MTVIALNFSDFTVKKMNRSSVTVVNNRTGNHYYMHRRIFNTVLEHPETPLFEARREWNGLTTMWLAAAMTL